MRYVSRRYLVPVFLVCAVILTMVYAALAQGATPGPPENLNASVNEGSIYLTWSPPMDQGDSSINAYLIFRGESPGTAGYYSETGLTSFEDFGVNPGTTYYYQVSARNDGGDGPMSNEVTAMLSIPTYTLSGKVTDRGSGDGVNGARLEFQEQGPDPEQFETWTDGYGSYNIELPEGGYQVRISADGYDTIEDNIYLHNHQTMDFEFDDGGNGGSDDFNLSDILGIDEDKVERYVITGAIIAGAVFSILPLTLLIVVILLIMIFFRLGKLRKEMRAHNEEEGIFISKRRKRKHEERAKKAGQKKEEPPPKEDKKKTVEVEEEDEGDD